MSAPLDRQMRMSARLAVVATTGAGLVAAVILADWPGLVFFVAFTGIGSYLAIQRATNSIGWFLMLTGWGLALGSVSYTGPLDALLDGRLVGLDAFSAWANGVGWALAFLGFFGVTVVFPDGRLPIGRGRRWSRIGFAAMIGMATVLAFGPLINVTPAATGIGVDVPNPVAILSGAPWAAVPAPGIVFSMMFVVLLLGVVGLIFRYRRSVGLERLQYRWLVAAITFVAVVNSAWAIAISVLEPDAIAPFSLLLVIAYPTVPIAIMVAILRYRLFDIDRIISRTIAYAAVSAVLVTIFGGGVLLLSSALASVAGGQSIAVAGSTLIAYAAFQPVLGRVRRVVDRRFDRARYDGERTATVFAARVRDETDVEAVLDDLIATTRSVVAPTSLGLWLR